MNLSEPFFTQVTEGKKTVEGRLRKGKYANLKVGDKIVINGEFPVQVTDLRFYDSFYDLLIHEGLLHVLPHLHTIEEGVNVYHQWYTVEDEEEFGVQAIVF